jgi:hypothetical protein
MVALSENSDCVDSNQGSMDFVLIFWLNLWVSLAVHVASDGGFEQPTQGSPVGSAASCKGIDSSNLQIELTPVGSLASCKCVGSCYLQIEPTPVGSPMSCECVVSCYLEIEPTPGASPLSCVDSLNLEIEPTLIG